MKATGIVRRIDDLGRVVIPKEIRRTMRIREGDPLEIYTSREGEVIFKKYSLLGSLEDFALQFCDTLSHNTDFTVAVTDRDSIIAVAGSGKRELLGKTLEATWSPIMEQRNLWLQDGSRPATAACTDAPAYTVALLAPILCQGDVLGSVLFLTDSDCPAGETECKLAQTVATFLGKNMES
ncbi:MAG: stage V sporulation protein T [Clostridiales bacterium]|nr:stage V sporulation protein T [Clostridiales bacterium]